MPKTIMQRLVESAKRLKPTADKATAVTDKAENASERAGERIRQAMDAKGLPSKEAIETAIQKIRGKVDRWGTSAFKRT